MCSFLRCYCVAPRISRCIKTQSNQPLFFPSMSHFREWKYICFIHRKMAEHFHQKKNKTWFVFTPQTCGFSNFSLSYRPPRWGMFRESDRAPFEVNALRLYMDSNGLFRCLTGLMNCVWPAAGASLFVWERRWTAEKLWRLFYCAQKNWTPQESDGIDSCIKASEESYASVYPTCICLKSCRGWS